MIKAWFVALCGKIFGSSAQKLPEESKMSDLHIRLNLDKAAGLGFVGTMRAIDVLSAREILSHLRIGWDEDLLACLANALLRRLDELTDPELKSLLEDPPYLRTFTEFFFPVAVEFLKRQHLGAGELFELYKKDSVNRELEKIGISLLCAKVWLIVQSKLDLWQLLYLGSTSWDRSGCEQPLRGRFAEIHRISCLELSSRLAGMEIRELLSAYEGYRSTPNIGELLKGEINKPHRQEEAQALLV